MSIERAAYHEAGHMAVARHVGLRLNKASLAGHGRYGVRRYADPVFIPDAEVDGWTRRKIEARTMATLAGAECEALYFGRADGPHAQADDRDAFDLALYLSHNEVEEAAALLDWLRLRASNVLRRVDIASDVELLARALLERGQLSRNDAEALFRPGGGRRLPVDALTLRP